MKRPLQISLAIALALSGTDAFALGLGTIHVNSKLNQPLDAEIPVIQGAPGEADGLLVQLASAEDFDRVGLNRARLAIPLEFSIVKGSGGQTMVKITSKDIIREPFLDFLVEANWPKGRLLREYSVLLDPPVMAPASGSAVTTAAKATAPRATVEKLPEAKPKPAKTRPAPVAAAPAATKEAKETHAAAAPHKVSGNEYGPVEPGETLSAIARDVRSDESANLNQLMLALLKANPNAFYKNNINMLKRGAILRIPSADEVKAVGSASEAAAEVHSQIEDWRGSAAAAPTLVAETGKPETKAAPPAKAKPAKPAPKAASTGSTATAKSSERLELVPPKAGKGSVAMAERQGSGGSSSAAMSDLKAELARTKEALSSREQESTELKSRVKELEDTKSKTDRLINLKDSEIADLQRKLKELQESEAKSATAATKPATAPATPASSTAAPVTGKSAEVSKEDIWGKTTPGEESKPATPAAAETKPPTPAATTGTAATTPAGAKPETPTPPAPGATTGSTTTASAPASTATPAGMPATAPAATPPKPAVKTAPKPIKKTLITPPPPAPAWYEQAWVKPAAIGAAALVLLLGLLGLRKRKAAPAARGSIAGAFGDSPLRSTDGGAAAVDSEEEMLREQLQEEPSNAGLHLELLSLLYAERNVAGFEEAAEAMRAHVTDPHQPEWLEAKAMGQELAPHNPLFSDEEPAHHDFEDAVTARHPTAAAFADDDFDDTFAQPPMEEPEPPTGESAFGLDLDAHVPEPAPAAPVTPPPPAAERTFAFDDLPPLDFDKETAAPTIEARVPTPAPAPAPVEVDDDFAGEDGVGTKLDLAKAYLDMGDPEGARSMLEEVLAEGNDAQKGEARRLMGEIR